MCFAIVMSNFENYFGNYGILIRNSIALSPYIITVLCTNAIYFYQPGLIKYIPLCTFCATPFYVPHCTLCCSFKEKCPLSGAKTQVKYVNRGTIFIII